MSPPSAIHRLQQTLQAALQPTQLRIEDDSAQHAGHAGAAHGGHYRVFIVSEAFNGRSLIARHRMVYEAVREDLKHGIHALSIVARSPAEDAAQSGRSGRRAAENEEPGGEGDDSE
ncbi:MAG TPA: BolA family protein [Nevskiaceae bacterium]